jgi:transcriptional regulator with PAS, ATPase and Fis domain
VQLTEQGIRVQDAGSKNGTFIGDSRIKDALVTLDTIVTLAQSIAITFHEVGAAQRLALAREASFGTAIGASAVMRLLFGTLEQGARAGETVLIMGESGTGKELLARAVHEKSAHHDGPFIPFDCGAVSPQLIEAELFGHVRGAFTGATYDNPGALASAAGGTLFLDEVGELPLDLQPKLLRALEARTFLPVGSRTWQPFTGRVVAATNRDLASQVRDRVFREDLYYRLAVISVRVPPLRERVEDIELLVERFLHEMTPPRTLAQLPPNALAMLKSHDFPGNVRELKNTVLRLVLFGNVDHAIERRAPDEPAAAVFTGSDALLELPLREARDQLVGVFERWFLVEKLRVAKGNVSRAAEAMGVSRQFLHRLLLQHDIKARG